MSVQFYPWVVLGRSHAPGREPLQGPRPRGHRPRARVRLRLKPIFASKCSFCCIFQARQILRVVLHRSKPEQLSFEGVNYYQGY